MVFHASWHRQDNTRLYPDECYNQMLQWREAYFYGKLHPEAKDAAPEGRPDELKKQDFEDQLMALRAKAVPRKQRTGRVACTACHAGRRRARVSCRDL